MNTRDEVKHDPEGLPLNNRQMRDQEEVLLAGAEAGGEAAEAGAEGGAEAGAEASEAEGGGGGGGQEKKEEQTTMGNPISTIIGGLRAGWEAGHDPVFTGDQYKQPAHPGLPETISAREVYLDDSNADGRVSGRVQR